MSKNQGTTVRRCVPFMAVMRQSFCLLLLISPLVMSGCLGPVRDIFSREKEVPLPGKRISLSATTAAVDVNPELVERDILLPPVRTNKQWDQQGGNAAHAMGHLQLADSLSLAWREKMQSSRGPVSFVSQPVARDGHLYALGPDGDIFAYNLADGNLVWQGFAGDLEDKKRRKDLREVFGGGLALGEDRLFVTTGIGDVVALDLASGKTLWTTHVGVPFRVGPTYYDGRIFAITLDNRAVAISAQGSLLWINQGSPGGAQIVGSAAIAAAQGILLIPYSTGQLVALRPQDGVSLWSYSLLAARQRSGVSSVLDPLRASPVIADGQVYVTSGLGQTEALSLVDGQRLWRSNFGGVSQPWIIGDWLYMVTEDNGLLCLDRKTGNLRWKVSLAPQETRKRPRSTIGFLSAPLVLGRRILVPSADGWLSSYSPYDGSLLGRVQIDDQQALSVIAVDSSLAVLSHRGLLTLFR